MQAEQMAGPGAVPVGAAPVSVDEMAQALALNPTFTQFDRAALRALAARCGVATFAAGDLIMSQGDPGSSAYLILEGEVDVFVEIPVERIYLATLGRHNTIGELGAFTEGSARPEFRRTRRPRVRGSDRRSCRDRPGP